MYIGFKVDIILLPVMLIIVGIVKIVVFVTVQLCKLGLWLLEVLITGIIKGTPYLIRGIRWLWLQGKRGIEAYRQQGRQE